MRFLATVDLVDALEQEKAARGPSILPMGWCTPIFIILDELGNLPISPSGGAPLFYLPSKFQLRTSVVITTNLSFSQWAEVFGGAKISTALLGRINHHCHIL